MTELRFLFVSIMIVYVNSHTFPRGLRDFYERHQLDQIISYHDFVTLLKSLRKKAQNRSAAMSNDVLAIQQLLLKHLKR